MRCLPADRCGDVDRLNVALDRIEALPVINGKVVIDEKHNKGAGRITVNLWCRAEHEKKDQRPEVGLNKKPLSDATAVPTYDIAAEKLLAQIEGKHGGCVEAAQAARMAAAAQSSGSST